MGCMAHLEHGGRATTERTGTGLRPLARSRLTWERRNTGTEKKILKVPAMYATTDSHPSGIALAIAYTPHSHPRSRYPPYGGWARVHYDGRGGWGAGWGRPVSSISADKRKRARRLPYFVPSFCGPRLLGCSSSGAALSRCPPVTSGVDL